MENKKGEIENNEDKEEKEREKKLFSLVFEAEDGKKTNGKIMPDIPAKKRSNVQWTIKLLSMMKLFARIINPTLYVLFFIVYIVYYSYFFKQ